MISILPQEATKLIRKASLFNRTSKLSIGYVHRFVRTVTEPNLSVCLSVCLSCVACRFKSNLTFNNLTIVAMNYCLIVDNQHIVD